MISRRTLLAFASTAGITATAAACSNSTESEPDASGVPAPASDGGGSSDGGSSAAPAPMDSSTLFSMVTVTGKPGAEPNVSLQEPLEFTGYHSKVLKEGDGESVREGSMIVTRSAIFDATSGDLLASRWQDRSVSVFKIDAATIGNQAVTFFTSAKVGTRYIMAGETSGQKVLEVGDVVALALPRATGKEKPVPETLPSFTLGKDGNPTLDEKPAGEPPAKLLTAVSIQGEGREAKKGDVLVMHYRGWAWDTGEEFDSSWNRGAPFNFPLGEGKVIKGWDTALEGVKAGTQMVMAIPPDLAYGKQGQHQLAGKTLLFVADVLAVIPPAS